MAINNSLKLIYNGSIILVLGLGFIVVSTISSILSKVLIITGISSISYGLYRSFKKESPAEIII